MCGRYTLQQQGLFERFEVKKPKNYKWKDSYNIAPAQYSPVIIRSEENQIELMRWGLVPFWAKDVSIGYKMINARSESVAEKPSFKKSFKSQRCIVPASGFYEWKKEGKQKQPYYFKPVKNEFFGFAGLYDIWKDAEGKELQTYTIITVPADERVKEVHDRMPCILDKHEEDIWLDNKADERDLLDVMRSKYKNELELYPVSSEVNSPANDSESLILST